MIITCALEPEKCYFISSSPDSTEAIPLSLWEYAVWGGLSAICLQRREDHPRHCVWTPEKDKSRKRLWWQRVCNRVCNTDVRPFHPMKPTKPQPSSLFQSNPCSRHHQWLSPCCTCFNYSKVLREAGEGPYHLCPAPPSLNPLQFAYRPKLLSIWPRNI